MQLTFLYKKGRERWERDEMEHRHLLDYNLSLFSTLKGFLINGIIVIFLFFIGLNDALLTNLWCFYSQSSVSTPNSQIVPQRSNSSMTMLYFSYIFTWSTPVNFIHTLEFFLEIISTYGICF